jgi:hypothetical protein
MKFEGLRPAAPPQIDAAKGVHAGLWRSPSLQSYELRAYEAKRAAFKLFTFTLHTRSIPGQGLAYA